MDSIEIAIESFQKAYGTRKWTKRIFILTDGETPMDIDKVNRISNIINNNDIRVNIITINFFRELEEDPEMEIDGQEKKETETQKQNKKVLKNLMEQSQNVKVFTEKMASTIHKQFRKKRVKTCVKYRGPLYFSDNLFIDVNVYTKSIKTEIPSLKKFSKNTEYSKIKFF